MGDNNYGAWNGECRPYRGLLALFLSGREPAILRGHPLESTDVFTLCKKEKDGDPLRVIYRAGSTLEKTVLVTVEDGFFRIECPDKEDSEPGYVTMHLLYNLLKRSFHIDITHSSGNGLTIVEADDLNQR